MRRASWLKCSSPVTYKHLRPGRHAFRVRAVGAAGTDATPALREFKATGRTIATVTAATASADRGRVGRGQAAPGR